MPLKLMLRYTGQSCARRCIIERDDHCFWGGNGWVEHHGRAMLYRLIGDAHAVCDRLQRGELDGKPRREVKCSMTVAVTGDDVSRVALQNVVEYLMKAMLVSIDYEAADDGLVADAHVACGVKLGELKEVLPRRRRP